MSEPPVSPRPLVPGDSLNEAAIWQQLIAALEVGADLDRSQAAWFAESVYAGEAPTADVAAVLRLLHEKGETAVEVAGILDVLLARTTTVDVAGERLDIVGTGGDGHHSVNISTMASIVCAAVGVPVVKHGNRAATSTTGSADVLEELGVAINLPAAGVRTCVQEAGIGFCFAPVFHSSMRHAAAARRSLDHPTVFNLIGPLANPSSPTAMLVGCADRVRAPLMSEVLAERGAYALVVRGHDGLDEVSTTGPTQVWAPHGVVYDIDVTALGMQPAIAGALDGGDARFNAEVVRAVLDPESSMAVASVRDSVVANAALALVAVDRAGGSAAECEAAIVGNMDRARAAIADGRAQAVLARWIEVSKGCQTPDLA